MAVHQLLPSFKAGDAMGQAALHLQLLLRRMGHFGEIHAHEVEPGLSALARPARALRPAPDDWVFYHHGIASPLSSQLIRLRCRRAVVFHNISPARFYRDTGLEEPLRTGRAQLAALAPYCELSVGVSDFNARELREAGHPNVHTVRLFIEKERFGADRADGRFLRRLARPGRPTLLSVGRLVPHKRCEDLLSLHEAFLEREPAARLLFVGGADEGGAYYRGLLRRARALRGVSFLGRTDHAQLVAAYRASTLFVSMSEHEGFCVPLLEAMATDLPVMAYAAAAVPETLGGHGVAFTGKHFGALAEVARELHADTALREAVVKGQHERLEQLSPEHAQAELAQALRSVTPRRAARSAAAAGTTRPRVGIVVQRYGDVSGGAEFHARLIAQKLAPHWDLRILTTCARDHLTWANELPEGADRVDGLPVTRFAVDAPREMKSFNALSRSLFGRSLERMREEQWVAEQGPRVPGLLRHLAERRDDYDGFVFFTYLYAPTVWGLPLVADRALLVPTAHDEAPFQFDVYGDAFERPRALLCNTPEEAALIQRRFPGHAPIQVVGVGVDKVKGQAARFRMRFGIERPYLLYVGRLEAGKGVPELLKFHAQLRRRDPEAPELVLAGRAAMPLPTEGVRALGRISEEDKADGLAGALAAVVPSRFESLSLLTLEAFAQGTPVLARAESEVLRGQVERSGAGTLFHDAVSFHEGVRFIQAQRPALSRAARAFVEKHPWTRVVSTYCEALAKVMKANRGRGSSREDPGT